MFLKINHFAGNVSAAIAKRNPKFTTNGCNKPSTAGFIIPYLLVLNVGNGWVAGGCWDDY